ncbi:hypothetical protein MXB_5020, partial [Myxobolus squamalis]
MARLIVKGDKKVLRKIHEYQGCKQRVEITSTPVDVYINQLSCNFIKQAASDFTKFPHSIYRNLLSKISEGHLFLDTTFKIELHLFYQCLTLLTFDFATRLFITCVYVLMTTKI